MSEIKATNRMSGQELKNIHGTIDFITNPKTGKMFFTAGAIRGYVSPKVQENINTITLDDIQYAEVSIDGNEAVPTLMMKATNNIVRSL